MGEHMFKNVRICVLCEEIVDPSEIAASVETTKQFKRREICKKCVRLIMKAVINEKKEMKKNQEGESHE